MKSSCFAFGTAVKVANERAPASLKAFLQMLS
jgi:hypothetical protein